MADCIPVHQGRKQFSRGDRQCQRWRLPGLKRDRPNRQVWSLIAHGGAFDIEQAAKQLAAAWHSGSQPAELRQLIRPRSLSEGYDIQERLAALIGEPVVGWKIGLAGRNGYRAAGLERPIFGRVFKSRCFANGDAVTIPRNTLVTVELELALVIAQDVDPGTKISAALIESAHLGFEIVSSRLPDRKTIGVAATIADNAVSHAVVLGGAVDFGRFAAVASQAALNVDGRAVATGLSGYDLPDPFSVLGHLIKHLGERGQVLRHGDLVFTGTMTKPFDVAGSCELTSRGPEPAVRCRLETAL